MSGGSSSWQDLGSHLPISRTAAWTAAAATALGASLYIYFERKKIQWKEVGQISCLYIYPIKSCRGVAVQAAQCTKIGLRHGLMRDRVFILVTSDGTFITGRQEHRLLLAVPSLEGDDILVNAPEMDTLRISLSELKAQQLGTPIKTKLYGDVIRGYDCGDEIAGWFQRFLGKPGYRLLHYKEDLEPRFGTKSVLVYRQFFKKGDATVYGDLTTFLMLSESSVDDLNTRLEKPVTVRNFRPNLVVRGSEPFAEDKWRNVKIGNAARLRFILPMPRCMMTTINPETAIRDQEPVETLKTYRMTEDPVYKKFDGGSPCMGVGFSTDAEGPIKVGDTVYAAA